MADPRKLSYQIEVDVKDNLNKMKQSMEGGAKETAAQYAKIYNDAMSGANQSQSGNLSQEQLDKLAQKFKPLADKLKNDPNLDLMNVLFKGLDDPNVSSKQLAKIDSLIERIKAKWEGFRRQAKQAAGSGFPGMDTDQAAENMLREAVGEGTYNAVNGEFPQSGKQDGKTKQNMRLFGEYILGYMASNLIRDVFGTMSASKMMEAGIFQRTGTAFDFTSFPGSKIVNSEMRMANEMQRMEFQKQQTQMWGSIIGSTVGLGLGALTGGAAVPIGAMLGGALGGGAGELLGAGNVAELMRRQTSEISANKFLGQMTGLAEKFVGSYDEQEIAQRKFQARTGRSGIGGRGLGYSDAELYMLGLQQSGVTGQFDNNTFMSQLAFSRAYGYDPAQIMQSGVSTRYTGQNVGAAELMARKQLAETTGLGTRMPDLIQSLNQLSGIISRTGAETSEQGLLQMAMLPYSIFGNSARGRLPDGGMEVLMGMQGMFGQENGSAGDAFLFNALMPMHKGDIWQYQMMKEKGMFGEGGIDRLKSVFGQAGRYGKENLPFVLQALGGGQLSATAIDKMVEKGFNEDGTINDDFFKQIQDVNVNTEEGTQTLADLLGIAKDQVSGAEDTHATLKNIEASIGKDLAKDLREYQKKLAEEQGKVLKENWETILNQFDQGVKDFRLAAEMMKNVFGSQQEREQNIKDTGREFLSKDESNFMYNLFEGNTHGMDIFNKYKPEYKRMTDYSSDDKFLRIPLKMPSSPGGEFLVAEFEWSKLKEFNFDPTTQKQEKQYYQEVISDYVKDVMQGRQGKSALLKKYPDGFFNIPGEQGGPGTEGSNNLILNFNITGAERAAIHRSLDDKLDEVESMARPAKLKSSIVK